MPVSLKVSPPAKCECGSSGKGCCENLGHSGHCGHGFGKKILLTLVGVLIVYGIFYVGVLMRNAAKQYFYIGQADKMERMITVNGFGKITGANDIAVTTLGFSNTDKDVAKAQAVNKKVMDQVLADLKKIGIADNDLQSDYSVYPEYNYTPDNGQELKGYKVANSLTVKIRDLSKIPEVLGMAGKYGLTEVAGLSFTIDDPENLKVQARDKALVNAAEKAQVLANKLGVTLVSVVSYNEYEGSNDFYAVKAYASDLGGMGGGGAPAAISSGSKDVVMNVNVTYEIKQNW